MRAARLIEIQTGPASQFSAGRSPHAAHTAEESFGSRWRNEVQLQIPQWNVLNSGAPNRSSLPTPNTADRDDQIFSNRGDDIASSRAQSVAKEASKQRVDQPTSYERPVCSTTAQGECGSASGSVGLRQQQEARDAHSKKSVGQVPSTPCQTDTPTEAQGAKTYAEGLMEVSGAANCSAGGCSRTLAVVNEAGQAEKGATTAASAQGITVDMSRQTQQGRNAVPAPISKSRSVQEEKVAPATGGGKGTELPDANALGGHKRPLSDSSSEKPSISATSVTPSSRPHGVESASMIVYTKPEVSGSAGLSTQGKVNPTGGGSAYASAMPGSSNLQVLAQSSRRLDIGVFDNTHGWLRVRAEMDSGGLVNASLAVTGTAHDYLRQALPEMSRYLATEQIHVVRLILQRAPGAQTGNALLGDSQQQPGDEARRSQEESQRPQASPTDSRTIGAAPLPSGRSSLDWECEDQSDFLAVHPWNAVPLELLSNASGHWLSVVA